MAATKKAGLGAKFLACAREDKQEVVERNEEIDLIYLCLLARAHPLFIGEPGVAKSMVMELMHRHLTDAQFFHAQFFKATRDEDILGPPDLSALVNESKWKRNIDGALPSAHIAFLDEIFKASASVLNAMLTILNERKFKNNGGMIPVPLITCGFASNELPSLDRDDLRAFRDRLPVTKVVHDVRSDDSFKAVIAGQIARRNGVKANTTLTSIPIKEIGQAHALVDAVTVPQDVMEDLARLRRMCLEKKLHVNPRRFGEGVKLMQARAFMADRTEVNSDDIKVFQHVIWKDPEDEQAAYRVVLDFASEFERAAARFQDDYDPIKTEFAQLKAKGTIGENDQEAMQSAMRVQKLLKVLGDKVDDKIEEAHADSRDTTALDDLAANIHNDRDWIKKEAFGMDS